jgi:hypothetical protein
MMGVDDETESPTVEMENVPVSSAFEVVKIRIICSRSWLHATGPGLGLVPSATYV